MKIDIEKGKNNVFGIVFLGYSYWFFTVFSHYSSKMIENNGIVRRKNMRASFRLLFFIISVLLLSSCSEKMYPSINEDISIAATVNIKDNTMSFIDIENQKLIEEWKLKKPYKGALMLPDADSILLYGKEIETIDLYSLKTGSFIRSWKTGEGIVNGRVLDNGEVALVDQKQNAIRFFNVSGKEKDYVATEQNPLTIFEARKSEKLYVLSYNKEKLTVIDLNSKEKLAGFPIHSSASGAWINDSEIWIGGHGKGAEIEEYIHVYDLATGALKKKIRAPFMPIKFLGIDDQIFVLSHGSNNLYKLDKDGKEIGSITVGSNPFEMAFTGEYLLVAGYDSNDIHFIDPNRLEIRKTIPVGSGPFQIVLRERK